MSWTYLCDVSEIAPNTLKLVDAEGVRIVVANYGSGFRAMPPICPHMEEPLEESGVIANCVLTCTKHLWGWNLATLELDGAETEKPLKTYELKEESGRLLALVEEELTYDFDEDDDNDDDFFG